MSTSHPGSRCECGGQAAGTDTPSKAGVRASEEKTGASLTMEGRWGRVSLWVLDAEALWEPPLAEELSPGLARGKSLALPRDSAMT